MSQGYIGEIKLFACNFAPRNWALCNGQVLSISSNTALFSILGTTYGGNGTTTFALPNLQARTMIGMGQGPGLSSYTQGQVTGQASVTLTTSNIPLHRHSLVSATLSTPNAAQNVAVPSSTAYLGLSGPNNTYSDVATANTTFHSSVLASTGSGTAHENRQPYLGLNFCILLYGIYPARN